MSVNEVVSRSLFSKVLSIEPNFWSAFSLDAYESTSSNLLNNFVSKPLKIKTNAVQLLKKRLVNHRPLRDMVSIGYKGEPYDEVEKHYKLTRGLLETLEVYHYPIHIITGSSLILRDLDLLEKVAEKSFLHISVPVRLKEPLYERLYGSSGENNLLISKVRKALPKAHISVLVDSIVPFMGDDLESIEYLLKQIKRAGADSVHFSLIESFTFKQTQQLLDLVSDVPDLIEKWTEVFKLDIDEGLLQEGNLEISDVMKRSFAVKVDTLVKKFHLSTEVPRYIPKDYRYSNYLLSGRLFKRAYEQGLFGNDISDIMEIAQTIQSLDHAVTKAELKSFAQCESVRRDIDYFLFQGELKSYGQKSLF